MKGFGYPFSPEVEFYYNIGTAISLGQAVVWAGTAYNMEYPEPDLSGGAKPTLANQGSRDTTSWIAVPAVQQASSPSDHNGICGVAIEDIAATSWGHVAIAGVVDVRLAGSVNAAIGDGLVASAGNFVESAGVATATAIHAMALEAQITSGTCAAALVSAFLPRALGGQDITCGLSTA